MAVFRSAQVLANSQQNRSRKVVHAWKIEHKKMAGDLGRDMQDMVSGSVKTKELRRRGHPFGRRKGRISLKLYRNTGRKQTWRAGPKSRVPTPLLPINLQSGRLRRSFRIIPQTGIGVQSFRLQFTARHSKFVLAQGGTKKMVARGYWSAVRVAWKSRNRKMVYQMRLRQLQIMYGHG